MGWPSADERIITVLSVDRSMDRVYRLTKRAVTC
jgi:hypothetical protein